MKTKIISMGALFLLLSVCVAGAQTTFLNQVLLPGTLIPKFVDPLPVAGNISVINATNLNRLLKNSLNETI